VCKGIQARRTGTRVEASKELELEKWLDCSESPDIVPADQVVPRPRREFGAGFSNGSNGSMILWIVRTHENLYTQYVGDQSTGGSLIDWRNIALRLHSAERCSRHTQRKMFWQWNYF
jgi:hypothetical protein